MKRTIITGIIMATVFFWSTPMLVSALSLKLPYAKGQSFIVVQGYNTLPTHIGHDAYAVDFTQDVCRAYGKPVVAVSGGTAMTVQEEGYNGGYGTELIINHGNDLISRYAHMVPGSILVGVGDPVRQGQVIGQVGDTGLVAGLACGDHPGTHLHFAMDIRANDGALTAYKPEPISGYSDITAGNWYLSDNEEAPDVVEKIYIDNVVANSTINSGEEAVFGAYMAVASSSTASPSPVPMGGVSETPSVQPLEITTLPIFPATLSSTPIVVPPPTASSSTEPTVSSTISSDASSSAPLFEQTDDSANSATSWYDDNWFNLGNGFSGTLTSLTLEGRVSNQSYFASHIAFQEFKDPGYTAMIQSFPISDNAPFTYVMATATFSGLNIMLKPYFYYRLATIQDYQNRSVILAGTSSTGTYMWNNFVYGTGRVEYNATFTPYIVMNGIAATSTLMPPPLTAPTNLMAAFDQLALQLNISFSTSTDPDWSGNALYYEVNYSTSSVLSDSGWGLSGHIPVVVGNSYLIGVRARDDFGDISPITTTTWNFPPGFEKYYISPPLSSATQGFTVPTTTTLNSIEIFTSNFGTSARNPDGPGCSLSLTDLYGVTIPVSLSSDNGFGGYGCSGDLTFSFASSSPVLLPNDLYQWAFQVSTGNPSTQAWVQFYGTAENTAGGFFSDPSFANAKFVVSGQSGAVFAN